MKKRPLLSRKSVTASPRTETSLSVSQLEFQISGWLMESEFRGNSSTTIAKYRIVTQNLLWFLRDKEHTKCGKAEIEQFLLYMRIGHEDERGRWGNPQNRTPVRPSTVTTYFTVVRTLFRYIVREDGLRSSPLERMPPPKCPTDQIQPFSNEETERLRAAARKTQNSLRDIAIVLFLLDTGVRASELCALRLEHVDFMDGRCRVYGKGGKYRCIYLGATARKALWKYIQLTGPERDESGQGFVFLSDRGVAAGESLTRSGLLQLIWRLEKAAGIKGTRCSPHTFRHTFAVNYLRNGGNVFALKELLGHTSLTICNRYVAFAQADIKEQHRKHSPVDALSRRKQ